VEISVLYNEAESLMSFQVTDNGRGMDNDELISMINSYMDPNSKTENMIGGC
jgi:DNA mismatch repair ATPase MutL